MVSVAATDSPGLLQAYCEARDTAARDQLVSNYLPLVRSLCSRFRRSTEPQEDLLQVGVIGLLSAIDKFDPSHGARFSSLAIPLVLGAILNYLRDHGNLVKQPRRLRKNTLAIQRESDRLAVGLGRWPTVTELANACELSEDDVWAAKKLVQTGQPRSLDEGIDTGDESESATLLDFVGTEDARFDRSLDSMALAAALKTLPLREKTTVELRFYGGLTQRQTAERINVSQMHVSRLERAALVKLRRFMQNDAAPETRDQRLGSGLDALAS